MFEGFRLNEKRHRNRSKVMFEGFMSNEKSDADE